MMSMLSVKDLYNNIKNEPFKIPEDDGNDLMHTFFNPLKEGWLCKQGMQQFRVGISLYASKLFVSVYTLWFKMSPCCFLNNSV